MPWGSSLFPLLIITPTGGFTGLFVYSPHPGKGNLVVSIAAQGGTDPFGNAFLGAGGQVVEYFNTGGLGSLTTPVQAIALNGGGLAVRQAPTYAGPFAPATMILENSLFLLGESEWLAPSGDTSGVTDLANISNAFSAGVLTVRLLPGVFFVNNTVTIPTGCSLIGAFPVQADGASNYSAGSLSPMGSVIQAAGAFITGGPFPPAVIQCSNTTATQQGGQVIANISINAAACPAGSGVIGIKLHGAVGAGFIKDTVVYRPDGPCLLAENDGGTGFFPVEWDISNCTFAASRSSHGVLLSHMTDSNFVACYSHDNTLDGWNVGGCANTVWTGCRGETNIGNGWRFTGLLTAATEAVLTGCVAQLNQQSGFVFDASGAIAFGTYQLTGCMSNLDGQAAVGILAGFYDNGSKSRIMMTGCATMTNATGPAYGAYEGSVAFGMALTGCLMQGITAATHDDATNTHALSNLVPVPF